jgi:hypothetical protein
MTNQQPAVTVEWRWPPLSRNAHLFPVHGAQSLCRVWLFTGRPCDTQGSLATKGPDDCAQCYRRAVNAGHTLRAA